MKKYNLVFIFLFVFSLQMSGQVKFGIISGIAPNHIDPGDVTISTIDDSVKYTITNTLASWHLGGFLRLQTGNFYVKGSILSGFSYVDYDKSVLQGSGTSEAGLRSTEWQIDIPVEVGVVVADRVLINAGLMWSDFFRPEEENVTLHLPSSIANLYREQKLGYKAGIGFDFDWQATIELSYVYYPELSSRIILDNNVDYNFNFINHYVMVNFSWNFIPAGWN